MKKRTLSDYAMKMSLNSVTQEVLDILEADDGKPFEVKKEEIIHHLSNYLEEKPAADEPSDVTLADMNGQQIKDTFWHFGVVLSSECDLVLRNVEERDRDAFLGIQVVYCPMKSMLSGEYYRDLLWKDHTSANALMLSIEKDGEYIGYCGIKNTAQDPWEIAIELQPQYTKQGIGPTAVSAMLNALKVRLSVTAFRVRIDPGNPASQKMFERLGAMPNGISEFLIHDQEAIERCEEENAHLINDEVIALASKFGVEPRKLLSHVLEYTLLWD